MLLILNFRRWLSRRQPIDYSTKINVPLERSQMSVLPYIEAYLEDEYFDDSEGSFYIYHTYLSFMP